MDEDELSLHSSRLESEGSAIASTLHSESDSDLDRKFILKVSSKSSDNLAEKNRSDQYSQDNSNRSKIFFRNRDPGRRHV